jgi:pimeloyl-ACP methyl ester carboxylesterase
VQTLTWRWQSNLTFSTLRHANTEPVELSYERYPPPADTPCTSSSSALVILHGLFGSKQNWRSLSRAFAQKLGIPVYALDLRNHGQSPHVETMKNTAMAADVARFLRDHALDKVTLMGHSMQVSCILSMRIC